MRTRFLEIITKLKGYHYGNNLRVLWEKDVLKRIAPWIDPVEGAMYKITMRWTATSAGEEMNTFMFFAYIFMIRIPEEL